MEPKGSCKKVYPRKPKRRAALQQEEGEWERRGERRVDGEWICVVD
jgi:hypothetical protein